MAGILCMDWKRHTLRAWWIMYQSKVLWDWDHTASVMSKVCFMTRPVSPTVFHPFRKTEEQGPQDGRDRMKVTSKTKHRLANLFLGV